MFVHWRVCSCAILSAGQVLVRLPHSWKRPLKYNVFRNSWMLLLKWVDGTLRASKECGSWETVLVEPLHLLVLFVIYVTEASLQAKCKMVTRGIICVWATRQVNKLIRSCNKTRNKQTTSILIINADFVWCYQNVPFLCILQCVLHLSLLSMSIYNNIGTLIYSFLQWISNG